MEADTPKLSGKLLLFFFGNTMKERAVAGFSNEEILEVGRKLAKEGIRPTYDLLLEDLDAIQDVRRAVVALSALITRMGPHNKGNIAVKPSMLGLALKDRRDADADRVFRNNLEMLAGQLKKKSPELEIEVDAEDRVTVERAYRAIKSIRAERLDLACTIRTAVQMHLPDLERILGTYGLLRYPCRFVKGAGVYKDNVPRVPENELWLRMKKCFDLSVKRKARPFVATAADRLGVMGILDHAEQSNVGREDFEVEMIYGFGRTLARDLGRSGVSLRFYCPFLLPWCQDAWKPYVLRRFPMVFRHTLRNIKQFCRS